jgi:hypothetical protein
MKYSSAIVYVNSIGEDLVINSCVFYNDSSTNSANGSSGGIGNLLGLFQ